MSKSDRITSQSYRYSSKTNAAFRFWGAFLHLGDEGARLKVRWHCIYTKKFANGSGSAKFQLVKKGLSPYRLRRFYMHMVQSCRVMISSPPSVPAPVANKLRLTVTG